MGKQNEGEKILKHVNNLNVVALLLGLYLYSENAESHCIFIFIRTLFYKTSEP
jgi:hypothetical protein